jgi:hypothetical protein
MLKLISAAVLSIGSLLVVGCQSNGGRDAGASASMHTGSANMVCSKCGTTEMKTPVLDDKGHAIAGRYKTVKSSNKDACPDCTRMANEGMQVGSKMHCDACNGDVKVVAAEGR